MVSPAAMSLSTPSPMVMAAVRPEMPAPMMTICARMGGGFYRERRGCCTALVSSTRRLQVQTEDGGLSYWTSAIFGPDDSICALVAEGRFDGDAGSGDRKAAAGGAPWDGRRVGVR